MSSVRIVSLVAGVLALSGCYIDLGDGERGGASGGWTDTPTPAFEDPYYGGSTTYEIDRTTLAGDMGRQSGFSGGVYDVSGTGYDGYTSVTVHSQNALERWAVMSMINVQGGLEHPDLVPGARLTFDNAAAYAYGSDGTEVFISMLGCSGDEPSAWDFDQYAEQVDVQVDAGAVPGQLDVRFQARFAGYDYETGAATAPQIVDGSFSFTRP